MPAAPAPDYRRAGLCSAAAVGGTPGGCKLALADSLAFIKASMIAARSGVSAVPSQIWRFALIVNNFSIEQPAPWPTSQSFARRLRSKGSCAVRQISLNSAGWHDGGGGGGATGAAAAGAGTFFRLGASAANPEPAKATVSTRVTNESSILFIP